MKLEIYTRGPIACMVDSYVHNFDNFTGSGVIDELRPQRELDACSQVSARNYQGGAELSGVEAAHCTNRESDHVVVLGGWGEETEYSHHYFKKYE